MFVESASFTLTCGLERPVVGKAEIHLIPQAERIKQAVLTFAGRHRTLVTSCRRSQIARPTPPRMLRATSASSRILCADSLQFRTLKSRRNSTPKSGRRRGSGRPLPALPTQRVRKPFLPPCQSPPRRSAASRQSATAPVGSDLHCPSLSGCCSGKSARQGNGTNGTARR